MQEARPSSAIPRTIFSRSPPDLEPISSRSPPDLDPISTRSSPDLGAISSSSIPGNGKLGERLKTATAFAPAFAPDLPPALAPAFVPVALDPFEEEVEVVEGVVALEAEAVGGMVARLDSTTTAPPLRPRSAARREVGAAAWLIGCPPA